MQQTERLKLNIIEGSDAVSPDPINANFQALEEETGTIREALSQEGTAIREDLAALSAALGSGGKNCRVAFGSYLGTGLVGADHPVTIEPGFAPALVVTGDSNQSNLYWPSVLLRPMTTANASTAVVGADQMTVSWSDTGVSWYCTSEDPSAMNNAEGESYYWLALGYEAE